MTDQTTLAALAVAVCDSLIANDGQWQYRLEAYRAAAVPPKYRAAGVRVTGDAGLREAAQAVVDFDWAMWERGDVGTVVMRKSDVALMFALLAALRAALATEEKP